MTEKIWYIAKPGEERKFATTKHPSPHWVESIKKEGYQIIEVSFELPKGWDNADFCTQAIAKKT